MLEVNLVCQKRSCGMGRVTRLYLIFSVCLYFFSTGCATTPPPPTGKVDHQKLVDGTYEGSYRRGPVKVRVKITIESQRISSIDLLEHDTWRGEEAGKIIPDRIIQEQSTEVNAVSGATMSSRVIMNAVQNAVDKAKQK
jgi:uncharacterized protein with FMN-binding domain